MSLFETITNQLSDTLQEFKNDIISSFKNEIINLKQEIANLNTQKDEEINILKQEIINLKQELAEKDKKEKALEHLMRFKDKEIFDLQERIPLNDLLPKVAELSDYIDLMGNCLGLNYLDKYDLRNAEQINNINSKINAIIKNKNEYVIINNQNIHTYITKKRNFNLIDTKSNIIITNRGKAFIHFDASIISQYNVIQQDGFYCVDFNINSISDEFIYLILTLIANRLPNYDRPIPHLQSIMSAYKKNY